MMTALGNAMSFARCEAARAESRVNNLAKRRVKSIACYARHSLHLDFPIFFCRNNKKEQTPFRDLHASFVRNARTGVGRASRFREASSNVDGERHEENE